MNSISIVVVECLELTIQDTPTLKYSRVVTTRICYSIRSTWDIVLLDYYSSVLKKSTERINWVPKLKPFFLHPLYTLYKDSF